MAPKQPLATPMWKTFNFDYQDEDSIIVKNESIGSDESNHEEMEPELDLFPLPSRKAKIG